VTPGCGGGLESGVPVEVSDTAALGVLVIVVVTVTVGVAPTTVALVTGPLDERTGGTVRAAAGVLGAVVFGTGAPSTPGLRSRWPT
jgi:hypothetical protein